VWACPVGVEESWQVDIPIVLPAIHKLGDHCLERPVEPSPMKAGERATHRLGKKKVKLGLLGLECSSSLAGIPRIWGLEFCGKATAFTDSLQWYFVELH